MRPRFADTSYFVALVNPSDEAHAAALQQATAPGQRVVTTSAVVTEVANHLSSPANRRIFTALFDDLRRNPAFDLVHVDRALFDAAVTLYRDRPDKSWSLTDCISFVVMRERAVTDALTTDHHFGQAGYNVLLPLSRR